MYSISEVVGLALTLALAPIVIWTLMHLELRDKGFLSIALIAVFLSYVATIAEGYWLPDVFNNLEHALGSVTAISFALFATRFFRRSVAREGGRGR